MITDLKTTAKFDKFSNCAVKHDLQSAVYTLVLSSLELDPALVKFAYCVVETVATACNSPAGIDFVLKPAEHKLRTCVDEIISLATASQISSSREVRELRRLDLRKENMKVFNSLDPTKPSILMVV